MGTQRNGARTLLDLMKKACDLTRLPGFSQGIAAILGETDGPAFLALWMPLCAFVDALIAADNFYNRIDYVPEGTGNEDRGTV